MRSRAIVSAAIAACVLGAGGCCRTPATAPRTVTPLKQLGNERGVDVSNRDMRGVIQGLKDAEVLVGPQASLAIGLVQFRDKAFHGQLDQIERATTLSALTFVQGLLAGSFV